MGKITYSEAGLEKMNAIQALWERLNMHHRSVSTHFAQRYATYSFQQRRAELEALDESGELHMALAYDTVSRRYIGYCMAYLSAWKTGEIISIFVDEAYRGAGVADTLMRTNLNWLDTNGAKSKTVNVVAGNERTYRFYARYGFYPQSSKLMQVKN